MFQGDTEFFGTSNFTFNGFDKNVERSQTENIKYFKGIKDLHLFTRNIQYSEY